jgi:hypothetical protein
MALVRVAREPRSPRPVCPRESLTHPCTSQQLYVVLDTDTPHALQPDGFSVHPLRHRRHPRHRRESPKALSAPLNSLGRVQIPIEDETAGCTDMRANAQGLLDAFATA